jgi:polyhydroxybutyrate depolymerase
MTWERLLSRRLLKHSLDCNGQTRTALLYVPRHMRRRGALPLVLVFHGGSSSAEKIAQVTEFHRIAEREGFYVAYPAGTQGRSGLGWNVGRDNAGNAQDLRFVRELILDLLQRYEIDPSRIYAVGFSIGGSLVYELACLFPDKIAAAAVVSGTMVDADLTPARPLPLLHIHGTHDRRVPFKGGQGPGTKRKAAWLPVQTGVDRWREANRCAGEPVVIRRANEGVTTYRYVGQADVQLWLVEGGRHSWPGGVADRSKKAKAPTQTAPFSASEAIWRFFASSVDARSRLKDGFPVHPLNRGG